MTTEAYICDGIRTPIGSYGGALSSIRADDLAAIPLKYLFDQHPQIDWQELDDVMLGCANQAGEDNRNIARMAVLLAQLPITVPATTINRLCGSGMDAIIQCSQAIKSQATKLMLAGGCESMSRAPLVIPKASKAFSRVAEIYDTTIGWRFINHQFDKLYGTDSMGQTAENVADEFNISRTAQDEFALHSQTKYKKANDNNFFKDEIIPVNFTLKRQIMTLNQDEHPRDTSLKALAKLSTLFKDNGSVTAGNASGINDGAAVVLLANKEMIKKYSLTARVKILGGLSIGLSPRIMGMGPAFASEKLLTQCGLQFSDLSVIELNEAFAAQAIATLNYWGLDINDERVNPNGGAIALGHPLGMSGTRLVLTTMRQLAITRGRYGLCTMCIGVGQGIAILLENVDF